MNTPLLPDDLIGDLDNWSYEVKLRPAPLVPDDQKVSASSKNTCSDPAHKGQRLLGLRGIQTAAQLLGHVN